MVPSAHTIAKYELCYFVTMLDFSLLPLRNGRVTLRAMRNQDSSAYAAGTEDGLVRQFTHLPKSVYSTASTASMINGRIAEGLACGGSAVLTIADAASDRFAGSLVIFDISASCAEIGFWVHADFRGRGLTLEVLNLAIELARRSGLAVLRARTVPENQASHRVLTRAGFIPGPAVRTMTSSGEEAVTIPFTQDLTSIRFLPISTSRLQLRLHEHADTEPLQQIYTQPEIAKYTLEDPWSADDASRQVSGRICRTGLESTSHSLALVIEHQGNVVGDVHLWLTDVERNVAEIGWGLAPAVSGQGLATEAVTAVVDLGFSDYEVHRIAAQMDARNQASARLAERVGMHREAHLRQDWWNKGEWTDTLIYAKLSSDT